MASKWVKPVMQVAAAGLGAAVAGPLGGAVGGWLGNAFGKSAGDILDEYTKKFAEKAGEEIYKKGSESLLKKLDTDPPDHDDLLRNTLRLSLQQISTSDPGIDSTSWFSHWNTALASSGLLALEKVQNGDFLPASLPVLFQKTLIRLDAQGAALEAHSSSLFLRERSLPEDLLTTLEDKLPDLLNKTFEALLVKDNYAIAWRQVELQFRKTLLDYLARAEATNDETLRAMRQQQIEIAELKNLLIGQNAAMARTEAATAEWLRLAKPTSDTDARVDELIRNNDLEGAAKLAGEDLEQEDTRHARAYFNVGRIQELQFNFEAAAKAYGEAWRLDAKPSYGFRYAYSLQNTHFNSEAAAIYLKVISSETDSAEAAVARNNLASLYMEGGRMDEAEEMYRAALAIYLDLSKDDMKLLPDLSRTQNNLGVLLSRTKRLKDAEKSYEAALQIRQMLAQYQPKLYKSGVANTLYNLGNLYAEVGENKDSEDSYRESIAAYQAAADGNPAIYRLETGQAYNSLGLLYKQGNLPAKAEEAFRDALLTYAGPQQPPFELIAPLAANTHANLGDLYKKPRPALAANAYRSAAMIREKLVAINAELYEVVFAESLTDLADVDCGLMDVVDDAAEKHRLEAETSYLRALQIWERAAQGEPQTYLPTTANVHGRLSNFYLKINEIERAEKSGIEAETLLEPFWETAPEMYGDDFARILYVRALLCQASSRPGVEACALAGRALIAARDGDLRVTLQKLVDDVCSTATPSPN